MILVLQVNLRAWNRDFADVKLSLGMDFWVDILEIWQVFRVSLLRYHTCLVACTDCYKVMIMPNQPGGQLQVNIGQPNFANTTSCFFDVFWCLNRLSIWNLFNRWLVKSLIVLLEPHETPKKHFSTYDNLLYIFHISNLQNLQLHWLCDYMTILFILV